MTPSWEQLSQSQRLRVGRHFLPPPYDNIGGKSPYLFSGNGILLLNIYQGHRVTGTSVKGLARDPRRK